MTSKDLEHTLNQLECYDSADESSDDILGKTFDACLRLYELIENCDLTTGSKEFQSYVTTNIKKLEKCTLMVNELNLFSTNETVEEIQTSSLRYLLLPALLGSLTLKQQHKEMAQNLDSIKIAEVYFHDFLRRCKNYELCKNAFLDKCQVELLEDQDPSGQTTPNVPTVTDLVTTRQRKIELYKEKKKLQGREKELKPALDRIDSEEHIREYYLVLLERWIVNTVEELDNTKREKPILESIAQKAAKDKDIFNEKKKSSEIKPLKPFIITKNETQKKVFGMGYPSLPVMTIEDFYRERFEKYVEEHKAGRGNSLQEKASSNQESDHQSEVEDIQKEELLERDDLESLKKARAWDDWKDDNPRGSGNRKNKG